MKDVCAAGDSASRKKRQGSGREKGPPTPSLGELVTRIDRGLSKTNSEKPNGLVGKRAKILDTEFLKLDGK